MTTLTGGTLVGRPGPSTVAVSDGLIRSIDGWDDGDQVDLTGLLISPGLIDVQVNGGYGDDFTTDPSSIWRVGARLVEQGVTAFLPTIITAPAGTVERAIEALSRRPDGYSGAEPLGLHLEGPMISPRRPGVHDPTLIVPPSIALIDGWRSDRGVAMVTLAPELPETGPVVERLTSAGIVVSAGHSAAGYEDALQGFDGGITAATHLFNAMEPFDHRDPGLVGAVFDHSGVVAGVIVDGIHSHPSVVRAAWKLLGGRMALVTDAMAATGLGDGRYVIGSVPVTVAGGRATNPEHRLAGSTLRLDQAVRNLVDFTGCAPAEAIAAASTVPARLLGLEDRGEVTAGSRADFALFDDAMRVVATMISGTMVWHS